jgi:hypothetical protein
MKSKAIASKNINTGNLDHKKFSRLLDYSFAATKFSLSHVQEPIGRWQRSNLENIGMWIPIKVHAITANLHFKVTKLNCSILKKLW